MGIRNIFHYAANFANITEKFNTLRVSKIIQKAVIEVDEEGGKVPLTTGKRFLNFCSSLVAHRDFSYNFRFCLKKI